MNDVQISCFLAVAEHLNFTKAAEQLHITHPAVSQQIQSLEKELGVTLFKRTTRSVRLTEEGKTFLHDARQWMALSIRAKKRFSHTPYKDLEILSLGSYNYPSMFLLVSALEKLRSRRPELHPRLQVIPFQHIYRMLEEGDLDAVIGFKEATAAKIPASYREIAKAPMVCACARRHPIASEKAVCLDRLKEERLVLFAPILSSHPSISQLQGQLMGGRPPSEFYFCESAEAITVLIAAGYGISVLPDFLVPDIPLIARIPVADAAPVSFGVYYKSLQGNPALKTFMACAKECFAH